MKEMAQEPIDDTIKNFFRMSTQDFEHLVSLICQIVGGKKIQRSEKQSQREKDWQSDYGS